MLLDDFDTHKFGVISIPFAIAIVAVLILWVLINRFKFRWRPAFLGPPVIAHSIKSTPNSRTTKALLSLYWIFFLLPFILFIAWGLTVSFIFEPYFLGIAIALGPTALLLAVYIFCDYHFRGYVFVGLAKYGLFVSFIVILLVTYLSVYLQDGRSWIEIAYLYAFPPSLLFMISYAYCHQHIPNGVFKYALTSKSSMNEFVETLSNHDETCFKGSKKLNFWWSLLNFFFSLVVNFLYQLNYWFMDRHNEKGERDPAFYTAIAFFLVDFLLLLAQAGTKIEANFFVIIFLGYLVKVVAITFTNTYWISAHGFVFFFLSSFLLIRFILGFWKPIEEADLRGSAEDPQVKKLSEIMNKKRKIPTVTVVLSCISWIILVAALIVEIYFQRKKTFHSLPFSMTQKNALIGISFLSIPFSLMVCSCYYLYNNNGIVTVGSFIMYVLSIAALILFDSIWKGAKDILLLRLLLPAGFIFVFSCLSLLLILYYKKKSSFKNKKFLAFFVIYFLITLACVVLSIIFPFAFKKHFKQDYSIATKLIGLMVVLAVFIIQFYVFFVVSYLRERSFFNSKTFLSFLFTILCTIGFGCCTCSLISGIVFCCAVFVIFCILFSFWYTKHNDWSFTLLPYLWMAIPSFIILGLCIVALVLIKDKKVTLCAAVLGLIFALIFFGSSLFFWLQKKNFYFNWASVICLIFLILSEIALIVFAAFKFKKTFIIISIILLCIFITSLLGMLFFALSQSIANVIVVSNAFFPVRRLVNGQIKTMSIFNYLYGLTFGSCWFWGLLATVFFDDHPDYGLLASTGAILLIGFITCYFITKFDSNTFSSLKYIHTDEIKYAVNTAMDASNISIEVASLETPPNSADYETFMEYVNKLFTSRENVSLFLSSLKAELFVASDVAFRSARNQLHHYFHDKDYTDDELQFLTYEKGWSNAEKLSIYTLLLEIKSDPNMLKKQNDYDNKVKNQMSNRLKVKIKSEEVIANYKKAVKQMERSNQLYIDPDFNSDTEHSFENAFWRRMEEIYTGPMFDPNKPFNLNIIQQGQLGDCYLIAAMVAISKSPKMVQQIFTDPINNKAGIRCVNFHIMGRISSIIVDTSIPFRTQYENARPIACRPTTNNDQWWAPIVEKAYAKQYQSYKAIVGGNSHIAMYRLIGGFPILYLTSDMKTKEMIQNGSLWRQMMKWNQEGTFLCSGSNSGSDQDTTPQGIHFGHAYTILQVVEVYGNKLMQLRNPWGSGEWTGDWSDKSSKWTPKMMKALNFKDEEDGAFWMSFNDYINNFSSIYACVSINPKYHYDCEGTFTPGPTDGASPFSNGEMDATYLTQYVIRAKSTSSQPTLYFIYEKNGASVFSTVVLVYNSGEKLKYLTSGMVFNQFPLAPSTPLKSFEWTYSEPQKPVSMIVIRNKSDEPNEWHVQILSDVQLEITKI